MATKSKSNRVMVLVGIVVALGLVAASGMAYWGKHFADTQVHNQLAQEKIYFPAKGSAALDPTEFPGLQRYVGQQVDTGDKAKAYADEFIWVHMQKIAGGKTYAEVSTLAQADPKNATLAGQKNALFQGDMLRSSLLTAYAFSVFGLIAGIAMKIALAAALVILLLVFFSLARRPSRR